MYLKVVVKNSCENLWYVLIFATSFMFINRKNQEREKKCEVLFLLKLFTIRGKAHSQLFGYRQHTKARVFYL